MGIRGDNMVWQTPKTNWDTHPKAIEPSDMNRIEGNILAVREQISIPLRAEVVDSFPPHAAGRIIYHTGHKRAYVSDGSAWVAVSIEGDADVEHVLAGKTFSSRIAGVGAAGTMPNNGVQVFEPLNVDRNLFGFYAQGSKIKAAHRVATGVKSLTSRLYLHVTGLSFRPSLVYAIRQSEIIDPPNFRAYVVAYYEGFWPTRYIYFNNNLGEMYIHSFSEGEGVFEGGFRIRVAKNELPSGESYGWIAVE